jgi:hypothetical protein
MKGNTGTVKSAMAELTDDTNEARGFSLLLMTRAFAYVIGFAVLLRSLSPLQYLTSLSPVIGGVLARPQDRWPATFSDPFWAKYPYFLPCIVSAAFVCFSFAIVAIYFEEVRFPLFKECIEVT